MPRGIETNVRQLFDEAATRPKSKEGVPIMEDATPPDKWQSRAERPAEKPKQNEMPPDLKVVNIRAAESQIRQLNTQEESLLEQLKEMRQGKGYTDLEIKMGEARLNAIHKDIEEWKARQDRLTGKNRKETDKNNYAYA